jgi:hypothetical protein
MLGKRGWVGGRRIRPARDSDGLCERHAAGGVAGEPSHRSQRQSRGQCGRRNRLQVATDHRCRGAGSPRRIAGEQRGAPRGGGADGDHPGPCVAQQRRQSATRAVVGHQQPGIPVAAAGQQTMDAGLVDHGLARRPHRDAPREERRDVHIKSGRAHLARLGVSPATSPVPASARPAHPTQVQSAPPPRTR